MKRFIFISALLAFSGLIEATLTAKIDRSRIVMGESVTLELTLDRVSNGQPDFTLLDAVFHVGSTSRSSSTQIVNGETSSQTAWQVLLVPKSQGSHIIPPLTVDGETSQAIRLEVAEPDPNAKAQGDIFIELLANKESAYVQEEIILTVRLLYAINLKNGGLSEPTADGLIVSQINKGASYSTQRDGKSYQVLERKYAIYAEQSGALALNPVIFEGEVTDNSRRNSYSLFQRGRPIRQISPILNLDIKPIPHEFVNQDWIPATNLTLSETWSEGDYKVGEPITRTIHVVATGLSETQLPDIVLPEFDGAKIYQDKTDTMTRTDGERLIATKTIKYAVIPNKEGELNVPAFELPWFNTQTEQADVAQLASSRFEVGASETNNQNIPTPTAQIIQENPALSAPDGSAATEPTSASDVLSEPPGIWCSIALIFGSLWVLTTLFLLRRLREKGSSTQQNKPKKTNPLNANLRALKEATASRMQLTLIHWWNQEHGQNVTHLGQIRTQIDHPETLQALTDLENHLYSNHEQTPSTNWHQLAQKGGFKLKKESDDSQQGLPELY